MDKADLTDIQQFSIDFAASVTESSEDESDLVAKKGEEGLFSTLEQMFPKVRLLWFLLVCTFICLQRTE